MRSLNPMRILYKSYEVKYMEFKEKRKPRKTIRVRTGTYHINMLMNDTDHLFRIMDYLHANAELGYFEKGEGFHFKLLFLRRESGYIIGSMVKIKDLDHTEIVPKKSKNAEMKPIEDKKCGMVRFYMDSDQIFILEENRMISRKKFETVLREMISNYTLNNEPNNGPLMGRSGLVLTYDRYDDKGLDAFMARIEKLTRIRVKVKTLDNPHRGDRLQILKKQHEKLNADDIDYKSKKGMDKKSDIAEVIRDMSDDGHFDAYWFGTDASGAKDEYTSNSSKDNIRLFDVIESDTTSFYEETSVLIPDLKERARSNRKDKS
jgi:hypothetical protein